MVMNVREKRFAAILLLFALASAWFPASAVGQGSSAEVDVDSLLARMSPAERVGQLLLVGFPDGAAPPDSEIVSLVQDYHIGGVLLRAANGNLGGEGRDVGGVQSLISQLQAAAISGEGANSVAATPQFESATATPPPESATPLESATVTATVEATASPAESLTLEEGTPATPRPGAVPVPLFVAIAQPDIVWLSAESGMSPKPSLMGIGATWSSALSERMGTLLGRELEAVGINMLLGPSLDLANASRAVTQADIGTRSFGESPFWVGLLGRAYVQGIHGGGQGRVLSIVTHFPGLGAVDRDVAQEIPVVQDSLESHLNSDLAPFLKVMAGQEGQQAAVADGVLVTHVQFRDVAGGIQMTRPTSLDPQAMVYLLGLPEVQTWRAGGGLIVSDSLGMTSVKRFYDPQLTSFQAKRIAYDAFLAGNDLLCLDAFGLSGDWAEHFANVRATLEFFQSKYASDAAFQSRVDESVRRILVAKQRIYPRFSLESVVGSGESLAEVGQGLEEVAGVAADAVTLVYPKGSDLPNRIPALPSPDENLLIFEDVRQVSACIGCEEVAVPEPGTVASLLRSLYGSEGSGQIDSANVQGYLYTDLWEYLESPVDASEDDTQGALVGEALADADWIVFLAQDVGAGAPMEADALGRLLRERPEAVGGKKVVVIACGAPYYLDATDMAKVSAFYGVYSPDATAIEAGVRALFREFVPGGLSPVSIPGVGYRLEEQLRPDPQQMLFVQPVGMPGIGESGMLNIGLGDELVLQTGEILDRNGHIVPDGTEVVFQFSYPESRLSWERKALTADGRAQTRVLLDTPGNLMVSASCGEARLATTLMVTVLGDKPAIISTVPPPSPTAATPEATPGSVFLGNPEETAPPDEAQGLDLRTFLVMVSGLMGICAVTWASGRQRGMGLLAAETAVLAFAFGMLGYLAYGVGALLLERMPLLIGGVWSTFSWRWQPAIAAWIAGSGVGFLGIIRPRLALKMVQLGRGSEADGKQKRR